MWLTCISLWIPMPIVYCCFNDFMSKYQEYACIFPAVLKPHVSLACHLGLYPPFDNCNIFLIISIVRDHFLMQYLECKCYWWRLKHSVKLMNLTCKQRLNLTRLCKCLLDRRLKTTINGRSGDLVVVLDHFWIKYYC